MWKSEPILAWKGAVTLGKVIQGLLYLDEHRKCDPIVKEEWIIPLKEKGNYRSAEKGAQLKFENERQLQYNKVPLKIGVICSFIFESV